MNEYFKECGIWKIKFHGGIRRVILPVTYKKVRGF